MKFKDIINEKIDDNDGSSYVVDDILKELKKEFK